VRHVEHDGVTKMHIGLFLIMCKTKHHLGDLGMDGRIILKQILDDWNLTW
jgi:hypothetical protein